MDNRVYILTGNIVEKSIGYQVGPIQANIERDTILRAAKYYGASKALDPDIALLLTRLGGKFYHRTFSKNWQKGIYDVTPWQAATREMIVSRVLQYIDDTLGDRVIVIPARFGSDVRDEVLEAIAAMPFYSKNLSTKSRHIPVRIHMQDTLGGVEDPVFSQRRRSFSP